MGADLDFTVLFDQHVEIAGCTMEIRDAKHRGSPIGDLGEVVDEVAQRGLHLVECADHHHHVAE
jgi:hypothetical protein